MNYSKPNILFGIKLWNMFTTKCKMICLFIRKFKIWKIKKHHKYSMMICSDCNLLLQYNSVDLATGVCLDIMILYWASDPGSVEGSGWKPLIHMGRVVVQGVLHNIQHKDESQYWEKHGKESVTAGHCSSVVLQQFLHTQVFSPSSCRHTSL